MSDEELGPIDPDLASLLKAERARPARPDGEIERAYRVTEEALRDGPSRGPGPSPLARFVAPAATLAVGVALGFAWGRGSPPSSSGSTSIPSPAVVSPTPSAKAALDATPWTVVPLVPSREPSTNVAAPSSPAPGSASSAVSSDSLARERTLLETARAALARDDAAAGLDAIARHAREYPNGRLAEERDALRVRALVAAGRGADARAAADAFRKAHPSSVLQPSVDAAVERLP